MGSRTSVQLRGVGLAPPDDRYAGAKRCLNADPVAGELRFPAFVFQLPQFQVLQRRRFGPENVGARLSQAPDDGFRIRSRSKIGSANGDAAHIHMAVKITPPGHARDRTIERVKQAVRTASHFERTLTSAKHRYPKFGQWAR